MHVFFVALLFNHIGFLWRSYYQQNQSKAFKDSKNEKYEIRIEILIVKYRKNQCLNIFLLNLFNFFFDKQRRIPSAKGMGWNTNFI